MTIASGTSNLSSSSGLEGSRRTESLRRAVACVELAGVGALRRRRRSARARGLRRARSASLFRPDPPRPGRREPRSNSTRHMPPSMRNRRISRVLRTGDRRPESQPERKERPGFRHHEAPASQAIAPMASPGRQRALPWCQTPTRSTPETIPMPRYLMRSRHGDDDPLASGSRSRHRLGLPRAFVCRERAAVLASHTVTVDQLKMAIYDGPGQTRGPDWHLPPGSRRRVAVAGYRPFHRRPGQGTPSTSCSR